MGKERVTISKPGPEIDGNDYLRTARGSRSTPEGIFESTSLEEVLAALDYINDEERQARLMSRAEMLANREDRAPGRTPRRRVVVIQDTSSDSEESSCSDSGSEATCAAHSTSEQEDEAPPDATVVVNELALEQRQPCCSDGQAELPPAYESPARQGQPAASSSQSTMCPTPTPATPARTTMRLQPGTPVSNKGYVVYRGERPGVFQNLNSAVPADRQTGGLFKRFESYAAAQEAFRDAQQLGVIGALNNPPLDNEGSDPRFFVVTQSVGTGVYPNGITALHDGLAWRGGALYVFHDRAKADRFYGREVAANRHKTCSHSE
ncbi:hypothetical protein V5O48_017112 [Marasmius crinis-equi]|uniref:Ribonuclease H1 N-terminal domain-containing protein n=1 Tax=Marasmius crinis-equi TaxID=585013 RepID=A0ABR3EPW7_9AGAR